MWHVTPAGRPTFLVTTTGQRGGALLGGFLPKRIVVEVVGRYAGSDAASDPLLELAEFADLLEPIDAEWQAQIDVLNNKLTSVVLGAEMLSELADERTRTWAARLVRGAWGAAAVVAELQRTLDATRPSVSTTRIPTHLSDPLVVAGEYLLDEPVSRAGWGHHDGAAPGEAVDAPPGQRPQADLLSADDCHVPQDLLQTRGVRRVRTLQVPALLFPSR
jgi:hypothetical protein